MSRFLSWFSRFIAAFLRVLKPKNISPKEAQMPNYHLFAAEEIRHSISDRQYQQNIVDWIEENLRPLENDALFLEACRNRPSSISNPNTREIKAVFDRLDSLIEDGTPAHEKGHRIFDALDGAAIISNDPWIAKAYRNEIDAAFWAAVFHDNSTDVQHRYVDTEWECNHGELGAWRFYHATEGLIHEPVRLLAAYYIAAHPHMTKDKPAKQGTQRVWNDRLFIWNGRPVRIGVWVTRWADRLENGGDAATHIIRHALAAVDGARVGGLDLHHIDGFYNFRDQLAYLFTPKVAVAEMPRLENGVPVLKDGEPVLDKYVSMLKHLEGYQLSAGPKWSVYNQHDHRSTTMSHLMGWKVSNSKQFIATVIDNVGTPDFEIFVKLMQMKSGFPNSPLTKETIDMVRDLWNLNPPENQAHWAKGFEFCWQSYFEWLEVLKAQIGKATDPMIIAFRPLIPDLIERITA